MLFYIIFLLLMHPLKFYSNSTLEKKGLLELLPENSLDILDNEPSLIASNLINNNNIIVPKTNIENNNSAGKLVQKMIIWEDYAEPWKIFTDEGAVFLNFSNSDIITVLKYYEDTFKVLFITDDVLTPVTQTGKSLIGSKVNFCSNRPMSRREAWNTLITLLEIVGVTLQPASMDRVYRVSTLAKDSPQNFNKGPLPTYIGITPDMLPDTDMRIRYMYQVKNSNLEAVKNIMSHMQSQHSPPPIIIKELNSIIITDRVFNIKTIMAIINELESGLSAEVMSVISLVKLEANKIAALYSSIAKEEGPQTRVAGSRRTDTAPYFDTQLRVIPEPRTNKLIVLGSIESIERFEKFVKDLENNSLKSAYLPIHIYTLKYTQVKAIQSILTAAIGFNGGNSESSKHGGIRDGEKYFSQTTIVAEESTNSLIILSPEEEYVHIYDILQKIDIPQKQVLLDIVMMTIDLAKAKSLGIQLRNTVNALGKNVNIQTGVLKGTIANNGTADKDSKSTAYNSTNKLISNLIQVAAGVNIAGTSFISLGNDEEGAWGIIKMLVTEVEAKIIDNPFILVTNKYEAIINVGETRRIADAIINNNNNVSNSFQSDQATLQMKIVPQITDDNKVFITLFIENSQFTGPEGDKIAAGNKITRTINTAVLVGSGEMIALGGLSQDQFSETTREVPFLSKIPIIGQFFKSTDTTIKQSASIIFVRPIIINNEAMLKKESLERYERIKDNIFATNINKNCPIDVLYFGDGQSILNKSNLFSKTQDNLVNNPDKIIYKKKMKILKKAQKEFQ